MLIELTQGYFAEIDFSDYYKVANYTWHARAQYHTVYAWTWIDGKGVPMSHKIKPPPAGLMVDHKDRYGLNNRWNNLRFATSSQNNVNSMRDNPTGYAGVDQVPSGRWRARIRKDGVKTYIGTYDTAEEAAAAWDAVALEVFGEFAILNFEEDTSHDDWSSRFYRIHEP